MSHRNDSSRRHRKSRTVNSDRHYPAVSFDGAHSVEIPADDGKSPIQSRYSLASNPSDFKYMDEIAMLKRGHINKDAPKHPYDRRGHPAPPINPTVPSEPMLMPISPGIATLMGGDAEATKSYKLGNDGELKVVGMRGGGERMEVVTKKEYTVFQQSSGQRCLFTFKVEGKEENKQK